MGNIANFLGFPISIIGLIKAKGKIPIRTSNKGAEYVIFTLQIPKDPVRGQFQSYAEISCIAYGKTARQISIVLRDRHRVCVKGYADTGILLCQQGISHKRST